MFLRQMVLTNNVRPAAPKLQMGVSPSVEIKKLT